MVTFERMLFDYNEYMHHSGRLAEDANISGSMLLMGVVLSLFLVGVYIYYVYPILEKRVMDMKLKDTTVIYLAIGGNLSLLIYTYLEHAYGFLLVLCLIEGALYLIFTQEKLERVREFILRFF